MINQSRVLLLSFVLAIALSFPCFADQAQGLVKSIDASNNSIMINDPASGAVKMVHVHPTVISKLTIGSVVKATFKPGSDIADTLEIALSR